MTEPPSPPALPGTEPLPFLKGRRFAFAEDMKPFFEGKVPLPNFEPVPLYIVAGNLTAFYGQLVEGKSAMAAGKKGSALYALRSSQGGSFTGEGLVIMRHGYDWGSDTSIIAGSFALCRHEKVEDPGANHSRGWHPGHCKLCGMDMSVDSGD